MADFKIAYKITGGNEGGYVFDPADAGGETYCGISFIKNPHWKGIPIVRSHKPLHHGQIINDPILIGLVEDFYKMNYWNPVNGDNIPNQDLANQVYDMAVNSGVHQALKLLV